MEIVTNLEQVMQNAEYLVEALGNDDRRALDYVKRGTCFVVHGTADDCHFLPSRFAGYVENTFEEHAKNGKKDGRDTNPAITKIVGSPPSANQKIEQLYAAYCVQLGFEPHAAGSFGVERKYWDLRA